MSNDAIDRPSADEYPPYFERYIALVPRRNVFETLRDQPIELERLIASAGEARGGHRYDAGKWTIREVVGHVIEVERMLAYWAWCFARGDSGQRLPVDCEHYVANAGFERRTLASLCAEFADTRAATISFFAHLGREPLLRRGIAAGGELTPRALLYIVAGHQRHHHRVITEKYLQLNPST